MNSTARNNLFEEAPIPRAVGKLVVPTILSSLVMVLYNLADTFFVGQLNDPIQNAAVTLVAPLMLAFNAANNLFGVGSSSMMSRALGRKDFDTVRTSASIGLYCSAFFGILFSVLCLIFFNPLLTLIGADEKTAGATAGYMLWTVIFGAMPSILNVVMAYLVRSEGNSLHASIGTMSGCFLNMILDPVFIFGFNMGAAGAGLATFISNCFACMYFFVLLYRTRKYTFISLNPKNLRFDKSVIKGIFAVGIPASIQNILNVIGMTVLNNLAADYGPDAVAAMGIAQKIYMVPVQVALGGTQGVMPLVSYSYASKNFKRFKSAITFLAMVFLPSMLVAAVLAFIFSPQLMKLFIDNASVIEYGEIFFRVMICAAPFLVSDFLVVGVCQAIGRGKISLVFALLRKLVLEIPSIIILNYIFKLNGLPFGALIAEIVMSLIGFVTLMTIIKKFRSETLTPSETVNNKSL